MEKGNDTLALKKKPVTGMKDILPGRDGSEGLCDSSVRLKRHLNSTFAISSI